MILLQTYFSDSKDFFLNDTCQTKRTPLLFFLCVYFDK